MRTSGLELNDSALARRVGLRPAAAGIGPPAILTSIYIFDIRLGNAGVRHPLGVRIVTVQIAEGPIRIRTRLVLVTIERVVDLAADEKESGQR
jgi:hypothetical protein